MTDLVLGPDVYHGNGHFDWAPILAAPSVRFAWCKASQYGADPECAYNLNAFKAAADKGDIDWYGAYHWPTMAGSASQVALYLKTIGIHAKDPRFRWVIDVEGGTVGILNLIAAGLTKALGKERGGIYGGAFLIGPLGNPTPAQCPAAAALPTFFRAGYVNDPPGHGVNRIPNLYATMGPQFWQYTNGVSGPADQTRFPRSLPGRGHGDISCFWEPTAHQTYAQWLAATTPGGPPPPNGGDDELDTAEKAQLAQAANAGYIDEREAIHHGLDTKPPNPWRENLAKIRAEAARKVLGVPDGEKTPVPEQEP